VTYGLHERSGVTNERALADHIRQRNDAIDTSASALGRNPGSISRCLLVGLTADQPFASLGAFADFVGRYQEAGIDEFVVYWCPDQLRDTGFYQRWSQRFASTEMLERLAAEVIPACRQGE
jgi:hypothetical protein